MYKAIRPMSFAHSTGKLSTQCPYCEHLSPEGSKFCNECGAALHLRPCSHCGALNDVSLVDVCGRCGETLLAPSTSPEVTPAAAEQASVETELPALTPSQHFDAPGPREDELSFLPVPKAKSFQPRWRVAVALLVLIIGGGAVFLVSRQPAASTSAQAASPLADPVASSPVIDSAGKEGRTTVLATGVPKPQSVGAELANANPTPTVDASHQPAVDSAPLRKAEAVEIVASAAASAAAQRRRLGLVSSTATPPPASPPGRAALPSAPTSAGPMEAVGLGTNNRASYPSVPPKPAKIGACTEAIAALGLCTTNEVSTQR